MDLILCMSRSRGPAPYTPCFKTRCRDCGDALWIAPASAETVNRGRAVPLCLPCGGARAARDDTPTFAIGPGQEAELLKEVGPEGLERARMIIKAMNIATERSYGGA